MKPLQIIHLDTITYEYKLTFFLVSPEPKYVITVYKFSLVMEIQPS